MTTRLIWTIEPVSANKTGFVEGFKSVSKISLDNVSRHRGLALLYVAYKIPDRIKEETFENF